jgi:hypothetical protein
MSSLCLRFWLGMRKTLELARSDASGHRVPIVGATRCFEGDRGGGGCISSNPSRPLVVSVIEILPPASMATLVRRVLRCKGATMSLSETST